MMLADRRSFSFVVTELASVFFDDVGVPQMMSESSWHVFEHLLRPCFVPFAEIVSGHACLWTTCVVSISRRHALPEFHVNSKTEKAKNGRVVTVQRDA
jgi:hypothetical protein